MQENLYLHRKLIAVFCAMLLISGIIMAYFYWGIEPQETIAGALCGLGFGGFILFISLKKPK
jgi:hypothetical protein